jgi:superfamily II RNA helicase
MTPRGDLVAAFARTLTFNPDPFQREAMLALAQGESVLVTAPTGSHCQSSLPICTRL